MTGVATRMREVESDKAAARSPEYPGKARFAGAIELDSKAAEAMALRFIMFPFFLFGNRLLKR